MLNPMNQDHTFAEINLVDDPKVSTSGRVESFKFAAQRLARPLRIICDRAKNRFNRGRSHFVRKLVEASTPFGRDVNLERLAQR